MTTRAKIEITRPRDAHWPEMLDVLRSANFHHIGSPEMEKFPLSDCFVALVDGVVKGVGGYRVLDETTAKTTLLAVDPASAGLGIGPKLQKARLDYLRASGIRTVTTNTDDPRVIAWLERRFGFRRTGKTVEKVSDFGRDDTDHWVSLRVDWPARD